MVRREEIVAWATGGFLQREKSAHEIIKLLWPLIGAIQEWKLATTANNRNDLPVSYEAYALRCMNASDVIDKELSALIKMVKK